tara:strand:- start:824 stop:1228 length:405 start_codon:yes stop_codon:yes gene_type:complete
MKLENKKELAKKVLKVGKGKIIFDESSLAEIKEAITKQDIRDLHSQGVIKIKDTRGKKKVVKRKRRRQGSIKKKVKKRKQEYVKITRKLRNYILELKKQGKIDQENYIRLRKEVKARDFKSKAQLRDILQSQGK